MWLMPGDRVYAAAAAVLLAMPAGAAEPSRASLAVSATVVPACSVGVAPAGAGGELDRAAASCTAGIEPVLSVERGSAGGVAPAPEAPDASVQERNILYLTLTY